MSRHAAKFQLRALFLASSFLPSLFAMKLLPPRSSAHLALCRLCLLLAATAAPALALDSNGNGQSDVWEMVYGVSGLAAAGDADRDGFTNAQESAAGTHPLDPASHPSLALQRAAGGTFVASWAGLAGKKYTPLMSATLAAGSWTPAAADLFGAGGTLQLAINPAGAPRAFFRLEIGDRDLDGDGLADWEEYAIGFDPARVHSGWQDDADATRVTAGLGATSTITVSVYDDACSEHWPDPALLVVRRAGGLGPLTVNMSYGGTATRGSDYIVVQPGSTVSFGPGVREVFVEVSPIADADDGEATETVVLTAIAGGGYTLGAENSATVSILNETATSPPGAKAAARFLIQAAFGPDQDSSADADQIPENVEEVMALGYAGWLADQFTRPIGTLRPFVQWAQAQPAGAEIYGNLRQYSWWGRAMGLPKLRPDAATTQLPDPLRQRVAWSLSQIFVISDRMEDIAASSEGMTQYYDLLLTHALGNFRDLLLDVSLHPCMGMYLSHLANRKADPIARTFPDENYAREVMQLFSIGLWMLNPDGTRQLDGLGQPIPTYSNANITEFARVFTGLAFGGSNTMFATYPRDFTVPMKAWDAEHDCDPKTLLLGATTPARTPSPGNTGTATMADVNAAIDNLFNHPNVGPFIGRLLIQRFTTSNPTPAYVGRVAAAFADNGSGVRGDMKAVVSAILLDPEARDPAKLADPTHGKLREPFLKCVNLARAFNAASQDGWYALDTFDLDHVQQPLNSPSVFNFYLPTYSPPGLLQQAGLVAPEFQIVNATSAMKAPNYFKGAIFGGLHRWGYGSINRAVFLNLTQEMLMNVPPAGLNDPYPAVDALDPDALLRRLDLVLTGGTLRPRTFQIIREAMLRLGRNSTWDWPKERMTAAIYLIVTSPEFAVLR
jgi:uncharacterized protein (DUF1800 family)